jgi:hypothetical protein
MVASWKMAGTLVVWAGTLLGGCSETLPLVNLPALSELPDKVLSKDEQQKTMNDMIEEGQPHQADAVKQIE